RHLGLTAEVVAQDLERDLAVDVSVLGLVDDAHAALAEPAGQTVAGPGHDPAGDEADPGALAPGHLFGRLRGIRADRRARLGRRRVRRGPGTQGRVGQ